MASSSGIAATLISSFLNFTTTGSGMPTLTMPLKARLATTASTATTAGTELSSIGYTTGGGAFVGTAFTTSTAGSPISGPVANVISWVNGGASTWELVSVDLTDTAAIRLWWGLWNGQPVPVIVGNTFQIGLNGLTLGIVTYPEVS